MYEFSVGRVSEGSAEEARLQVAIALRTGKWPWWTLSIPCVRRWLDRETETTTDVLPEYERHLRAEVSESWAKTSLSYLRELQAVSGKLLSAVTGPDAEAYLVHILTEERPKRNRTPAGRRSVGTRNRARSACSRFFRWLVSMGYCQSNPFASTRQLREEITGEIIHLSRSERDSVVDAAKADPEGIAVGLAVYTGLRRGEMVRCRWEHVDLTRMKLRVPESKNKRPRVVDLPRVLVAWLSETPENRRRGPVVGWMRNDVDPKHAADMLIERILAAVPDVPETRIGWNSFRHTFASLLVQAGVSIFKVAKWLGNRPEVAERHYAAMMPGHDEDIERGT